ncbi:MAG: FGGY-family carbohydrate kinase [Candidatus Sumerlaeia bacterium]
MDPLLIGIDVGTGSARAGLFDATGRLLGAGVREIAIWRPQADFVEQSSEDIWAACGAAVRDALGQAGVRPEAVCGIGFDATCSLVALDAGDRPVTVSPTGRDEQNVIVWMDHRAIEQAGRINATNHAVLKYVGGVISPEMQSPKLLWLKQHLQASWNRAARFFDLPDFLVYRATGEDVRSLCTVVCKWSYLGHEQALSPGSVGRWEESYWRRIGLGELADEAFRRIGRRVRPVGERAGALTERAARELGLEPGTAVGVSLIDAHAGGVGMLGAMLDGRAPTPDVMPRRLALIGGTSSCHMAVSQNPIFIPGVWGPYFSVMIPGMWLSEGGQSATGALVDHVIFSHARSADLLVEAERTGRNVYELLNELLETLARGVEFPAELTSELHVLPYFHGNRSPRADPTLRGAVSGLRLSDTLEDLALLYLATIQAIAYGTRHIIAEMNKAGYQIETIFACGGGTKNPVFLREHADITGCRIALPREPEAVLLGAAVLGASAAGVHQNVLQAMAAMNGVGRIIEPAGGRTAEYHRRKYRVFQQMFKDFMRYRGIMQD